MAGKITNIKLPNVADAYELHDNNAIHAGDSLDATKLTGTASINTTGNAATATTANGVANNISLGGAPTATTPATTDNSTRIATTAYVKAVLENMGISSGGLAFQGTINSNNDLNGAKKGYTYSVATAGTYAGQTCEVGDLIICTDTDTFTVLQGNIDGAVVGPSSAVTDRLASYDGTTGKIIKDSGIAATDISSHLSNTTVHVTAAERSAWNAKSDTNTTYTLTQDKNDGHKFTFAGSDGSSVTITIPDADTTYTLSSLGIGNVKNYDQSKAIKSITRSGTTFTYTCLDNTTGTFTQQDNNTWTAMVGASSTANGTAGYVPAPPKDGYNTKYLRADGSWAVPPDTNTTYGAATTTAAGLMSAADKVKLDDIAQGATANTGTITGIKMNGASKGTSGVVDLGTVLTAHQDISGKFDKSGGTVTGATTFQKDITVTGGASINTSGYVVGTWLQATASNHLGSTPSTYAVLSSGWIYNRTLEETKSDLGVPSVYTATLAVASWSGSGTYTYNLSLNLKCGSDGATAPLIFCTNNQDEYNYIDSAVATAGTGIAFTASTKPTSAISILVIDFS